MEISDILFSVNEYDRDGDIIDEGIYLHFGDVRVKVADSVDSFKRVAERISSMIPEMHERYSDAGI